MFLMKQKIKERKKEGKKKVTHDDLNAHAHKALLKLHPFSILRSITLLKDTKVHGFHFATHKDFVNKLHVCYTDCVMKYMALNENIFCYFLLYE